MLLVSFLFLQALTSSDAFAEQCSVNQLSSGIETARVKWVYDGDTLLLSDKRKIRIIGIDAPEVKHHQQSAQAYGAKAREALRELLKKHHYRVQLSFGEEKKDRYGRLLAHVFLPDGTNLSSWLLKKGFARIMPIPPNVRLANCYKQAQASARQHNLRIWRQKSNQLRDAAQLPHTVKGHVRLRGTVKKIITHKKSLLLELDSKRNSPIKLTIRKKYWRYFNMNKLETLYDRKVRVSGYLANRHGKRILYLSHPSQLEIIPVNRVKPLIKWSSTE